MDRILFGDNQFFAVNHMSEEKSQAQAIRFLFWRRPVSLSLALILVAGVGFVAGCLWGARRARAPR